MVRRLLLLASFWILFPLSHIFSADLLVPTMELITRGYSENGVFLFGTVGNVDLDIAGGYKFGGSFSLSLDSDSLEDFTREKVLSFKAATVTARELLSLPLDITYFIGKTDIFCNGDIFAALYGSPDVSTRYRGYMYFPETIPYDGIHGIGGTGFKIATSPNRFERFLAAAYVYQDSYMGIDEGPGYFSTDFRGVLNLPKIKLDGFFGATFPYAPSGLYRMGLLFYYKPGNVGEFLTQIGIPRWNPAVDPFSINLFYFLFEPRLKLNAMSIILTLFWHPSYYLQQATSETGTSNININFSFGDLTKFPIRGGLESSLSLVTVDTTQFQVLLSPYFTAITSGILWNIKVNFNVYPFSVDNLVEGFIGIRAEF